MPFRRHREGPLERLTERSAELRAAAQEREQGPDSYEAQRLGWFEEAVRRTVRERFELDDQDLRVLGVDINNWLRATLPVAIEGEEINLQFLGHTITTYDMPSSGAVDLTVSVRDRPVGFLGEPSYDHHVGQINVGLYRGETRGFVGFRPDEATLLESLRDGLRDAAAQLRAARVELAPTLESASPEL